MDFTSFTDFSRGTYKMKQVLTGILAGVTLTLLSAAYNQNKTELELERLRTELRESNRHLAQISRSMSRIEGAFSSGYLKVRQQ